MGKAMTTAEALTTAYKFYRQLWEMDFPEEIDAEWHQESCETICDLMLMLMHEINPQVYVDCVAWDAGREELSETTQEGNR